MRRRLVGIAGHTFLGHVLDLKFAVLVALATALGGLGGFLGARETDARVKRYEQLSSSALRNRTLDAVRVVRPPSPYLALVEGRERAFPAVLRIDPEAITFAAEGDALDRDFVRRYGTPDWAWSVAAIFSLMTFLFGYGLIAADRERGTLRLFLSQGIPRAEWLLGRHLGTWAALALPLLLGFLLTLATHIVASSREQVPNDVGDWLRLAAMLLTALLYVGALLWAALAVSSVSARSATSLALALFLWAGWVVLWPVIAPAAASWLQPRMTHRELTEQLRAARTEWEEATIINTGYIADIVDMPVSEAEKWRIIAQRDAALRQKQLAAIADKDRKEALVWADYLAALDKETRLSRLIARVSPASAASFALESLAGSGYAGHRRFLDAARRYQEAYADFAKGQRAIHLSEARTEGSQASITSVNGAKYAFNSIWAISFANIQVPQGDYPDFAFLRPSFAEGLRAAWIDLLLLLGWNASGFLTAYALFLRYDVR